MIVVKNHDRTIDATNCYGAFILYRDYDLSVALNAVLSSTRPTLGFQGWKKYRGKL